MCRGFPALVYVSLLEIRKKPYNQIIRMGVIIPEASLKYDVRPLVALQLHVTLDSLGWEESGALSGGTWEKVAGSELGEGKIETGSAHVCDNHLSGVN